MFSIGITNLDLWQVVCVGIVRVMVIPFCWQKTKRN